MPMPLDAGIISIDYLKGIFYFFSKLSDPQKRIVNAVIHKFCINRVKTFLPKDFNDFLLGGNLGTAPSSEFYKNPASLTMLISHLRPASIFLVGF